MKQIEDRLLLAALTGTIAAVAANLFLYIINLFLPGKTLNMPQLTLEIFLNIASYTILQRILGFVWSLVIGGIYAFIYLMVLDWTGWRHPLLKAVFVVSGMWLAMAGLVMKLLNLAVETRDNPLAIGAFYVAHIFFALVVALLVLRVGEQDIHHAKVNNQVVPGRGLGDGDDYEVDTGTRHGLHAFDAVTLNDSQSSSHSAFYPSKEAYKIVPEPASTDD